MRGGGGVRWLPWFPSRLRGPYHRCLVPPASLWKFCSDILSIEMRSLVALGASAVAIALAAPVAAEPAPAATAPARCNGFRCPLLEFLDARDWSEARADARLAGYDVRVLIAVLADPIDPGA